MRATIYVRADKAELVVDVTGADPNSTQSAPVKLWSGRTPTATASGQIATLAETWVDNVATTGSGQTFGSLAALTAGGRNVSASVSGSRPSRSPSIPTATAVSGWWPPLRRWTGGNPVSTASALLGSDAQATLERAVRRTPVLVARLLGRTWA